jgi:hypothetical protein
MATEKKPQRKLGDCEAAVLMRRSSKVCALFCHGIEAVMNAKIVVLLLMAISFGKAQTEPPSPNGLNPVDLQIAVSKWNRITNPGRVLDMHPKVVLVKEQEDYVAVAKAKKIGDEQGEINDMIAQNHAIVIHAATKVRLLQVFCPDIVNPSVNVCSAVPYTLQGIYRDKWYTFEQTRDMLQRADKVLHRSSNYTLADYNKGHERMIAPFVAHSLSGFVDGTYALVRVVDGTNAGVKGWVSMDNLDWDVPDVP